MTPPILVQTPDFVVLDKPAGLPVHAGPRGGASVEDWFGLLSRRRARSNEVRTTSSKNGVQLRRSWRAGPWLAHRLDADTAGCLVIALRRAALLAAQALFAEGRARKTYWAVVDGAPAGESGTVEANLAKRSGPGGWRMVVDPAGQSAVTDWHVLGRGGGLTWLELRPRTGRTHQVRVHCAHLGCPVRHDPVYGGGGGTLNLLARAIELPLSPALAATAPPPAHMRDALRALGWDQPIMNQQRNSAVSIGV